MGDRPHGGRPTTQSQRIDPGRAALVEALPDPTVLIDADGVIVWINRSAELRVGRDRDEVIGLPGFELVHPDDLHCALHSLESVQGKRVGTPVEIKIRTEAGWALTEVIGAPVGDGHIVLTMRDLTERRRWEVAGDETARLRSLVHHAPALFLLVDGDGRIVASSGAVTRMLGHAQEHLEGSPLLELVSDGDRDLVGAALRRSVAGSGSCDPVRIEANLRDGFGARAVPYELTLLNLLDDPTVDGVIVTGHDVSDRVAAEHELHEMVSLLNATLDSTVDGVIVVDLDQHVTSFNRKFVEMWRMPAALVATGIDAGLLEWAARQVDDPAAFLQKVQDLYADPEASSFDMITFTDGRVFERSSTPQRVDDRVVGRVWSFHDVTRQKQLEAELEHQAFHDSLTGLSNQSLFRDRVGHAIARSHREGTSLAVLYLDIDDFKRVNDSLGHPTGDQLLVDVADRLRSCVREADTAARLGGDEFAILIEDLDDSEQATDVAQRIVEEIRAPFHIGWHELVSSVSLGVAFGSPDADAEQLLRNADLAMYAAKRHGKSTFEVYEPDMHAEAVAQLEREAELRLAVQRDEFWLAFQPVVELASNRIVGFEALVRWKHPHRGQLCPLSFIDTAEDMGIMADIGDIVVGNACRQAAEWARLRPESPYTVSLNVSASQLADGSIVEQVDRHLRLTALDPSLLVVEITETAMLHDTPAAVVTLRALKELGVRLALDDFGTGFSSITHLQRFPIDILKIDRSFMTSEDRDVALVKALLHLADELGLAAVAEGVETLEHADFLRRIGCRYGQGHLFAEPASADVMTGLLTSPHAASAS